MSNNQLRYVILAGIFAIPFVPLIISSSLFFPFITGKAFAFRLIVEIILACYLILAVREPLYRPKFSWVLGALAVFLIAIGLADLLAVNPYKAFWSNFERMEGYITLLHLGAYFLVMGTMLKTQEIWNKLLMTSLGASLIMAIYSFLQIGGKIAINQGGVRVDGTLGNAAYLGIYMVFHIFFAALLYVRFKQSWQRILLAVVALLDLIVLYFTATRGAILGLIGGAIIASILLVRNSEKGDQVRRFAKVGLISFLILVSGFLLLRNTPVVQNSPVLSRFASLSFSEVKTQGRYFVWPMAIKGFVENPIFGWGQEGFNFVFNKYYDPRMYTQEPWFDRAHNTFLDWLVAGGILGFLSYLSIIAAVFYYTLRAKGDFLTREDKAIVFGLLSAYLFNNLFVFDQIASYILFFILIAYVHAHAPETNVSWWEKVSNRIKNIVEHEKRKPILEALVLVILVIVIYFINFIPWRQNKSLLEVLRLGNQGVVGALEVYQKPINQKGIGFGESIEHISQAAIALNMNSSASSEIRQNVFKLVDESFVKYLEKVPNDARYRLFYGVFLSRFGWYGRAIEQLQEAIKLSPQKQQIYFELVSNLLLDGKAKEAAAAAKIAYELAPQYEEARFIYGLSLLGAGDVTLSNQVLAGISEQKVIFDDRYLSILASMQKYNDILQLVKKRIALDPTNLQHRLTLTAAYLEMGRNAEAIKVLEEMISLDPSFKERGEYYISEIKAGRRP
jgi:tetratricopeptide (TPR) repeat protein